ncbi:MAG TPA: TRAP transporter small permease [Vineibacter sp.]|nr:TRAP transporter small permease [Vineibacter sp.]
MPHQEESGLPPGEADAAGLSPDIDHYPDPSWAGSVFVRWPMLVLGWLMLAAVALNFANIIGRYVFHRAIVWTEEILIVWLGWSVFIAVVIVTYRGDHLAMDIVSKNLPMRWRLANNLVMTAVFAACLAFAVVQSAKVVLLMIKTGQTDPMMGMPLWVPNLAIFVGFAGSLCALLMRARSYVTGRF